MTDQTNITATEKDYRTLVVTKYMGSKKAILSFVAAELERLTSPGDILLDLMAGTHTIGYALKDRCRIVANDIQRFSKVIGETLLNYNPEQRFAGAMREAFRRFYLANMRMLEEQFGVGLRMEKALLSNQPGHRPTWLEYREFCESYPYYSRPEQAADWPEDFLLLFGARRVEAFRTLNKLEPYNLMSLFFANTYVGVRQAAEIDSLRCAIDKLCDQWIPERGDEELDGGGIRSFLMTALIATLNRINPGPGHWAAFPRVSASNRAWIVAQRGLPVYDTFIQKVEEFEMELSRSVLTHTPHIIMCEDYRAFMTEMNEYLRKARVVYLDPPYSQGHYSRFYHLVETLVHYDYPVIAYAGRYRGDRHQSPFAYKDKVAQAIGDVCVKAREGGAALVISYSQGGVIPDADRFRTILENYYPSKNIELRQLSAVHSKLGQAKRMKTVEYLFTCYP